MRRPRSMATIGVVIALALGIGPLPAHAQAQSIEGTYDLFDIGNVGGRVVGVMLFSAQSGTSFSVTSSNPEPWNGTGDITNNQGYYDWRFPDGRTGRTTIVVGADGNLYGHVFGSGLNWMYVARRREGLIRRS
jgi:hypothetical protein